MATPSQVKVVETLTPQEDHDLKPRIMVLGIGGAGSNAVNNMIRSELEGVEFLVCNTDAQALKQSVAKHRIQLGIESTQGLGAGSKPEIGKLAAEESLPTLLQHLEGVHMLFITAGMGGGTGTGAAPVIAQAAREKGILVVAVVTKPFHFEGAHRMRNAENGIEALQGNVDTQIIIPNQNLFRVANEKTTFADAFKMADDVLYAGVRSVTDLMIMPGLINLDFADIRTVMTEMGKAMMGTGEAAGENRAIIAAEAAIANPLLDDVSMRGAKGVLISITGGMDMTLFEVEEAATRIRDEIEADANIIFGSTFDEHLEGKMRVSVVATGIDHHIQQFYTNQAKQQTAPTGEQHSVLPEVTSPMDKEDVSIEMEEEITELEDLDSIETNMPQEEPFAQSSRGTGKKPGLFQRLSQSLTGKKATAGRSDHQPKVRIQTLPKGGRSKDEEISDVPAYLRRKK